MELDHLVVVGQTLEEARAVIEEALGVPMQAGGKHAVFGTHNALLHLADGLYLEAIAKDPDAVPEKTPCWYGLDHHSGSARLTSWACRTSQPQEAAAKWPEAGAAVDLRRGAYHWTMFVPEIGVQPYDGLFPALLSWHSAHPAPQLTPQGCRLQALYVTHPDGARLQTTLQLKDPRLQIATGPAAISAEFETPHGLRRL
ncbi:VOC family protein [Epibacterium sp. SM1979]|uniref:VOC family protein n=1 Tax=Tritonibacter litoralis TaxID=2662264 RepID=A0A843Y8W6_9RHOB|nr:VOC family protein [Tritonibacter litoralis]MQQ07670.1 VOC family protein [Tritonibacter litoralis]